MGTGKTLDYHVYRRMEFSSDRKRMSILLKDPSDGKIKLYVKGADNVILARILTEK
jgi:magnesium-transporting ATPase (P-type)